MITAEAETLIRLAPPGPDGAIDVGAADAAFRKRGPRPDDSIRPVDVIRLDGSVIRYWCPRDEWPHKHVLAAHWPPPGYAMREVPEGDGINATTFKFFPLRCQ